MKVDDFPIKHSIVNNRHCFPFEVYEVGLPCAGFNSYATKKLFLQYTHLIVHCWVCHAYVSFPHMVLSELDFFSRKRLSSFLNLLANRQNMVPVVCSSASRTLIFSLESCPTLVAVANARNYFPFKIIKNKMFLTENACAWLKLVVIFILHI